MKNNKHLRLLYIFVLTFVKSNFSAVLAIVKTVTMAIL